MAEHQQNTEVLSDEMEPQVVSENSEILANLQDAVNDSINNIQKISTDESKLDADGAAYSRPGPLPSRGHDISTIMELLEAILMQNDAGTSKGTMRLPPLEPAGRAVLLAHSLAACVAGLDRVHLQKLTTRLTSDTTLWVSRLFRFFDSSACFHEEPWEGLVRLCQALLRLRYPKYEEEGYEVLYSRPPIIYISSAIRSGLGQHLCTKLGLPRSSISIVPCNTVFGSQYKMDVAQLERVIQEDLAAQKIPLLVVSSAGAGTLGQVDNLQRLQEICKTQDLWLHVEGHSLAGLSLVAAPTLPAKVGDSISLPLGHWLGITSIPNILLYKTLDPNVTIATGLTASTPSRKLCCLPVWMALQSLGQDGVTSRIHQAFNLSRHFQDQVSQVKNVKLVGRPQSDKDNKSYAVSDLTSKPISTSVLFDILVPTVVFQYVGMDSMSESETDKSSPSCSESYLNSLNSWLGQILLRDAPYINLDIMELDNGNVCLRYCPLDGYKSKEVTVEILDLFVGCIAQQVDILNATVKHRDVFPRLVKECSSLQCVELADWAGLGGVRYIPKNWVGNLSDLPDTGKEEVNKINQELVILLKNTDSAFSLGEGEDGLHCVRFGMVTEDTDMEELIELIVNTGREIEETTKYFETMSEMVKKGIETANEDLKKENEERIWQDGILRHVPVVSSLYNWWAPLPKESGVKGRSFSLSSGVIESTENTYKYHMQIKQGVPSVGLSTPKPSVQTPVVVTPEHSQTSSMSSVPNLQTQSEDIPSNQLAQQNASEEANITAPEIS